MFKIIIKYQQHNVVNLILGGVATSTSKRKDKLTLREIMAAKRTTPRYLDWSEYLIQFTMDDQWTRFSNANRYPLVLNPTIAGVQLTEVLIDDGAGLNIIFASTLKKMGLDITNPLTLIDMPVYGIVLKKAAVPVGQVTLPITHLARMPTTRLSTLGSRWPTSILRTTPSLADQPSPSSRQSPTTDTCR